MEDREILKEFFEDNRLYECYKVSVADQITKAIKNLLKENENLKQAIKINQDLYEKIILFSMVVFRCKSAWP